MLQFVTNGKSRGSIPEQAREVLAGGCRWIELSAGEGQAEAARELLPVCRDSESFLMITDDVELVDELKVHGVHLSHATREKVLEVRERLGAHAVIGVGCATVADALALKKLDIDYIAIPVGNGSEDVAAFAAIVGQIRHDMPGIHIVARGEFPATLLQELLEAGAEGVAVSSVLASAENPTEVTAEYLKVLNTIREK